MIQFPNCKINLGLNIIGRRSDGFHDIETVFYPISLHDVLEIVETPDDGFQFHSSGLAIPGAVQNNLCVRAYQLLKSDFDLPGLKIHLHKVIPMGSGLGGGSSNGAFVLKIINELFSLGLKSEELKEYARLLGSDCAVFIDNYPVFAFEKGSQFEQITIGISGLFLAIVIPEVNVSTADAYAMVIPGIHERSLKELIQLPMSTWREMVVNDFEKPVFEMYPAIGEIKQILYDAGAIYASLSGSGSAVYGLFNESPDFASIFPGHFLWTSKIL